MRWMRDGVGVLAGLCLAAAAVRAADRVEVVKPGAAKVTLDLSRFQSGPGAAVFAATLEDDLRRSGWFVMAPAGQGAVVVQGQCEAAGRSVSALCQVVHAASGRTYVNTTYRGGSDEARRLAHRAADDIVRAVRGVKGMASSRVAMVGQRGGKRELFLCDADGQNLVQLTHDNSIAMSPAWAPDGGSLVYTSYLSGYPDVYWVDLANNKRKRIVFFPGLNTGADVSPDGAYLLLTLSKDGNPELYVLETASQRIARLTRTGHAAEASPAWSPDGNQIAFVSDQSGSPQVYVMNARNGQPKRITFEGSENVAPDWGPGGTIVFSSKRGGFFHVCVYDPRTGQTVQYTAGRADHEDPSWAPDGRHIVYARTENYRSSLYVLDTLNDPEVRLLSVSGEWYSPAWSP